MLAQLGVDMKDVRKAVAALALIEDSALAIQDVLKRGIELDRRNYGEAYLRLSGLVHEASRMASAIKILWRLFRPHDYDEAANKMESHVLYDLRQRLGSHVLNYNRKEYHVVIQADMFRKKGRWSYVASDKGFVEVDIMSLTKDFVGVTLEVLLKLTEWKARKVVPAKSEDFAWVIERLDFIRQYIARN